MEKKVSKNMALAGAALGLGLLVGLLSAGFLHFVDWGQDLLWESGWSDFPFAPLLICTVGGLLVGLCQRYFGNHPQTIAEATRELAQTGRLAYQHLAHGLATVGASLIFGASLGPEAAIMDLLGGLSTWAADRLNGLRSRLHLSQTKTNPSRFRRYAAKWPNILVVSTAMIVFGYGISSLYGRNLLIIRESFSWQDLIWSLPLGALGAAMGGGYVWLSGQSQKILRPLEKRLVLRAALAGIVFGFAASLLPMMLFSGQHDLQYAYDQATQLGAWLLFLIALFRLVMTALLLGSGWKGGQFLPLMFASSALGLACSLAVPGISAAAGILAVMAGLLAVVLPKPLVSLILMILMFPVQYAGIVILAVAAAAMIKAKVSGVPLIVPKTAVAAPE